MTGNSDDEIEARVHRSLIKTLVIFVFAFGMQISSSKGERIAEELFEGTGYVSHAPLAGLNGGTGWTNGWSGVATVEEPGLAVSGVSLEAHRASIRGEGSDQAVFRSLTLPQGADATTAWVGFLLKKDAGQRYFGISLFNNTNERLFIGTPNGSDQLRLGPSVMTTANVLTAKLIVVRIDYRPGNDKAYLFINPSLESTPDAANAIATIEGDFSFNRIRFTAGGGAGASSGAVSQISVGTGYADVVYPDGSGEDPSTPVSDPMPVLSWEKRGNALWIETTGGTLKLQPVLPKVLRVQFGSEAKIDSAKEYAVLREPDLVDWSLVASDTELSLVAPGFSVRIDRTTSRLRIFDATGKAIVQEPSKGGRLKVKDGITTIRNVFHLTPDEALYGLGQYRDGALNLRGKTRELVQFNTQAAVPVLLSTNGWGMLWDNPSRTFFADAPGGLSFSSEIGSELSYYVFVGKHLDDIVSGYRDLTGAAPLPPQWALGFHQSRNKYRTQAEVMQVANRMRDENIPMDSIFIDYFYWQKYGTGSHRFDETLFPNVPEMIRSLHEDLNTKVVVTVWPTFAASTAHYAELNANGYLLNGATALDGTIYDAFDPGAAAMYWSQLMEELVPSGIDGFFLDGPEPDQISSFLTTTTYDGPATQVRNVYPLVHSATFYNGLLAARPNERPYILTRCAWAGQQRNGTAIWSGDIGSSFEELQKQISAGLGFVSTGIPYWTTDIGGYSGGNAANEAYRETFTRWWQYGTFCPIFRSHGRRDGTGSNELWDFGADVQRICTEFSDLRYRLLPYIYSMSDRVTTQGYTPMRLLAFDFPDDLQVRDTKDQFMFGPSFLVSPIASAGATSRSLRLPAGADWVDFWTGETTEGGREIVAPAPLDRIPIHVKAGSIVPMGPAVQHANESPNAPFEVRVYRGADGEFTIYEDDGHTLGYETGQLSRIRLGWNDAAQTLTFGAREGTFTGMTESRTFHIVWVGANRGTGVQQSTPDKVVEYTGSEITVGPSFAKWIESTFPGVSDPSIVSMDADPDHDSIANGLEFALGLNPSKSDAGTAKIGHSGLPFMTRIQVDDVEYMTLGVRRPLGREGISYYVDISDDLKIWSDAVIHGPPVPDGTGFEIVYFRDIVARWTVPRRFMHLRISD